MGEIADMMLDGTLCEGCGELIDDGDGDGFPRRCAGCGGGADRPRRRRAERASPADGRDVLDRGARAYLSTIAAASDGLKVRSSAWNDPRFQACQEAGYVSYHKISNRIRVIRVTPEGVAYLVATRRTRSRSLAHA